MSASRYADNKRTRRVILGLFAWCLFAASIGLTWTFLKGGFRSGIPVSAIFSAPGVGQQLPVGGDVKIRGVLVGTIADLVLLETGQVAVEMRLDEAASIPSDSGAEIRSKTAFGQKWIELLPPTASTAAAFQPGDEIVDALTVEPLELERALQLGHNVLSEIPFEDLAAVLEALASGFSGVEDQARLGIDRGLIALKAVNSRSAELDLALSQLNEFSRWLDDNDDSLLDLMRSMDSANRALLAAAPEFRASNASIPVFLDRFTAFQRRTAGDLGALIEDGAAVAEIVAARVDKLVDLVVQLGDAMIVLNSGLSQPCEGEFETNMRCLQAYLVPGLDSRGIYEPGEGPDSDEPGDPNFRKARKRAAALEETLAQRLGPGAGEDLAALLLEPTRELIRRLETSP